MEIKDDNFFLSKSLQLARLGHGMVSPNPMVGCVLVKNGEVISQGYHKKYGEEHAELIAIKNAKGIPISGATAYVNLEPCPIAGKTPPCTKKIIENKIKKVVISMLDPNPKIKGKGVRELEENGIEVVIGTLENEARELNKGFIKWIKKGIPWVIGKVAQSQNGYMGMNSHSQTKITGYETKKSVHRLRSSVDCILVGKQTIKTDNPKLTVRHGKGQSPNRAILDSRLSLTQDYNIFKQTRPKTLVLHSKHINREENKEGIEYVGIKEHGRGLDVGDVLIKLGSKGVTSLLVEGGAKVLKSFYEADQLDEIHTYTSQSELEDAALKNPIFITEDWETQETSTHGSDQLNVYKKKLNVHGNY